jgi:hypothetical protein
LIQTHLAAVVQHEHLPVLKGRHRPGVDVEVGVDFDAGDAQAALLEQDADGRGRDAFPQARHDAARDDDVFHRGRSCLLGVMFPSTLRAGSSLRRGSEFESKRRRGVVCLFARAVLVVGV